jgi:hypothetical protein
MAPSANGQGPEMTKKIRDRWRIRGMLPASAGQKINVAFPGFLSWPISRNGCINDTSSDQQE